MLIFSNWKPNRLLKHGKTIKRGTIETKKVNPHGLPSNSSRVNSRYTTTQLSDTDLKYSGDSTNIIRKFCLWEVELIGEGIK